MTPNEISTALGYMDRNMTAIQITGAIGPAFRTPYFYALGTVVTALGFAYAILLSRAQRYDVSVSCASTPSWKGA